MCPVGYVGDTRIVDGAGVVLLVRCGCYGVLILLRVSSNRFGWQVWLMLVLLLDGTRRTVQ